MRKILLLLAIFITITGFSQTPESFKYQTIVRDGAGFVMANQNISFQMSIIQGSASGTSVYTETHSATTNEFGLVNLSIGEGTTSDDFSTIDWSNGPFFIKVELDENGGSSYTEMGTTELKSVPYAMYAKNVQNKDDADADPSNELVSSATLNGHNLEIVDAGGTTVVDLSSLDQSGMNVDDADADATNELQTINKSGSTVTLSNGGGSFIDEVDDDDADATNELQTINKSGSTVTLSNGGGSFTDEVNDADNSTTNELQTLSFSGNDLSLTDGGSISLAQYSNLWQQNGSDIYYNDGWVGIGTDSPSGKMVVQGDAGVDPDSALFEVKNKDGQTIFAVYDGGVRIWVDDTGLKANTDKGGFAVGGYRLNKSVSHEYLRITPDSARIYYDSENTGTGHAGGFQVEGFEGSTSESNGGTMHLSDDNYFIGDSAGINITTLGKYNSVFGYKSGKELTTGDDNVFVGYEAGKNTDSGNDNIFVGYRAGLSNTTGQNNVFIGKQSGYSNTTASSNTFIGENAGSNNTTGSQNFFGGYSAGFHNLTGGNNVYIGNYAGYNNTTGRYNVALGYLSSVSNTEGLYNVSLGYYAGRGNVDGSENVFVGSNSGFYVKSGNENVVMGSKAGYQADTLMYNIFIGSKSGYNCKKEGEKNVFLGFYTGFNNTTGTQNVFIGANTGISNTTGNSNVFLGTASGQDNTIGENNVFIGNRAGINNENGSSNVFMGFYSGYNNTSGSNNLFLGNLVAEANTTGGDNVFMGNSAGNKNTTGSFNVFIGFESGKNNTDQGGQTFIGYMAGASNTSGDNNTYMGYSAGSVIQTGSNNVLIGYRAGSPVLGGSSLTGNVCIGYRAGSNSLESNRLFIQNDGDNDALIYGEFDNDKVQINHKTASATAGLYIHNFNSSHVWSLYQYSTDALHILYDGANRGSWNTTSGAYTSVSDAKLKSNIEDFDNVLDRVKQLSPKSYNFNYQKDMSNKYIGFIAQDAIELFPSLVYHTEGSKDEEEIYMVDYAGFSVVAIQAVKEQQKLIEDLQSENELLKARLDRLESLIIKDTKEDKTINQQR